MLVPVLGLTTAEQLRKEVRSTLCEHDRLDPGQTPFFAAPIHRRNQLCGVLFHVEGPRLLKTSALWITEEHRILFYDSIGTRFREVRLSESPLAEEVLALAHEDRRHAA